MAFGFRLRSKGIRGWKTRPVVSVEGATMGAHRFAGAAKSTSVRRWLGSKRGQTVLDLVSFFHALFVLVFGAAVIVLEAPHWRIWSWREWLRSPTSRMQTWLLAVSCAYFCYDAVVILFTRRVLHKRDIALTVHHAICIVGLASPVLVGRDGTIVLLGFFFAELSNPPRLLAQILLRHSGRSGHFSDSEDEWGQLSSVHSWLNCLRLPKQRERVGQHLLVAHFCSFFATRLVCAHYAAHVVSYYATLRSTVVCCWLMLLFSALALWEYVSSKKHGVTPLV